MKTSVIKVVGCQVSLVLIFLGITSSLMGQETEKPSTPLPENVKNFVTASCMPCHSSTGGMLSRGKLNFDDWVSYTSDKQKEKAGDIYNVLSKNKMPPKNARETRPEIIPTKEQVDIIKKWVDSF